MLVNPASRSTCSRCGGPLGGETAGEICSPCEFAAAMAPPGSVAYSSGSAEPEDARRFGDYELLGEIAHGGMGVVFRARHVKLNRVVALKMLLLGQFASDQSIRRFQREAEAAAALRHPGIVSVHEVGEVDGQHYFTMELVEGRSLASLLQSGPLPHRAAAVYLLAIAEAVAHAHANGIVHRDLKPSNILIDLFDAPRITDFGLARRLDGTGDLTLTGHIVGSPNYLAPEILSGRSRPTLPPGGAAPGSEAGAATSAETAAGDVPSRPRADPASPLADLFSLGAVFYECLTGRPPFLGATLEETLLRVRDSEPVPPRVLNPRLPRDLETLCLKCLEKDPGRRYAGAAEFAEEIRRFLGGHPIQARPVSPIGKAWRWARRKPAMAAMVLALNLLLVGGVGGILWQWTRAETEAGRANRIAAEAPGWARAPVRGHGQRTGGSATLTGGAPLVPRSARERIRPRAPRGSPNPPRHESSRVVAARTALVPWQGDHRPGPEFRRTMGGLRVHGFDRPGLGPHHGPADHSFVGSRRGRAGRALPSRRTTSALLQLGTRTSSHVRREADPWQRFRAVVVPAGGARTLVLPRHTNIVDRAMFSPDGRLILTSCADGRVRVWRVESDGASVRVTPEFEYAHPAEVRAATFNPAGDRIATGARDGRYRVWDTATHQLLHEFDNAQEDSDFAFYARRWEVAFSPDGRFLLGGQDRRARVWSLDSGNVRFDLKFEDLVTSLGFRPDGRSIVSTDLGGTIRVWAADTGGLQWSTFARDHGDGLAEDVGAVFTPDGSRVVFWSHDGLGVLDAGSALVISPRLPTRVVSQAKLTADGRRLLVGTSEGQIQVWNVAHPSTASRALELGNTGTQVRFSPDGQRLVAGNWSSEIGFWDVADGRSTTPERRTQRPATYGIQALVPSPDGKQVLATDWGGTARVYDFATGNPFSAAWTNTLGVPAVGEFLPDGRHLVTADRAGVLRLHRLPDGTCLRSVTNAGAMPIQKVLVTPDGASLYTFSNDALGRRWDAASLEPRGDTLDLGGVARDARWSSDRRFIVTTTSSAAGARVWDVATGRLLHELLHPVQTPCADFSPSGRWIATASVDGTVRIWDARTGALRHDLRAGNRVLSLEFSRDGRWLAAGGTFGVRAWEAATGEAITPRLEVDAAAAFANSIAFSPDGSQLAGTGGGSVVRLWSLQPAPYSLAQWRRLVPALVGRRVDVDGELRELRGIELQAAHDLARREFPAEFDPAPIEFGDSR